MSDSPIPTRSERFKANGELKDSLAVLESIGDDRKSAKNRVIADNRIAWETGDFEDNQPPPESYEHVLIVRTRREGIAAQLNSADSLDMLENLSTTMKENNKALRQEIALLRWLLICTLVLVFTLAHGLLPPGWWYKGWQ